MTVKDIMTESVVTASPRMTLQEVAQQMKKFNVGFIPVVDAEQVVALLTDRDIVVRGVAEGKAPAGTFVSDVMTDRVWTAYEDEDIETAANRMREQRVRRLVAVDREDRPVGVVTIADLASRGDNPALVGNVLEARRDNGEERFERKGGPSFARGIR